jgi:3D (Asp-Asp-Asp) domain-containing protein
MMPRVLTRSIWLKLVVLVVAIVGFVLLYETRMFDSFSVARIAITTSEGSPLPGAQLPFSATAYCKGTTTASGVDVRTGIAAADPTVLPVGSVLNIAAGDQRYTGVYTVMDTGPRVQGRHLDLYMWSCHEALTFGRRDVQVTVLRLGWDPRASSPSLIDRLFRGRATARKVPDPDQPPAAAFPPKDGASPEEEEEGAPDNATPSTDPAAPATATPAPPAAVTSAPGQ